MTNAPKTGFAPVNGLDLYYEIHGSGEPLLVLHGGIGATEQFGPNIALWAQDRQVIVAHMQGHGFTRDIDRAYGYEQFADDVAGLLDHLKLPAADILGYSMGAGVATRLAIQHPEKVTRLVLVSGNMDNAGQYPEVRGTFPAMVDNAAQIGAGMAASPLASFYPDIDWETAFRKMGELQSQHHDWSADFAGITVPTLLLFADADCVTAEQIVAMYRALGGFARDAGLDGSLRPLAQLAVVPGRTHYNILETTQAGEVAARFLAQ
ncbi:MAG: alpha/beta hydrolase [Devosia sp.]|uniref:alpha/beta fold hydrolase n=1 Tax=Devosia sp. TaxID=1871048 RepID=UPI0024C9FC50|nr:alpha/beta hydrolase [Devosia sp.]UYN99518.1 MAG: alpha/beta hydrolase [Devosia sp.]